MEWRICFCWRYLSCWLIAIASLSSLTSCSLSTFSHLWALNLPLLKLFMHCTHLSSIFWQSLRWCYIIDKAGDSLATQSEHLPQWISCSSIYSYANVFLQWMQLICALTSRFLRNLLISSILGFCLWQLGHWLPFLLNESLMHLEHIRLSQPVSEHCLASRSRFLQTAHWIWGKMLAKALKLEILDLVKKKSLPSRLPP